MDVTLYIYVVKFKDDWESCAQLDILSGKDKYVMTAIYVMFRYDANVGMV